MANIPMVEALNLPGRTYFLVVTEARIHTDGFHGARWAAYDTTGKQISYGYSEGRSVEGIVGQKTKIGSMLTAMQNARRACRRHYTKESFDIYEKAILGTKR